jgi:hypothetical protein
MKKGRPPVLDDAKRREICAILAMGGNRETAARYVGCHRTTIAKTAERDEAFAEALSRAESLHEVQHLTNINRAGKEGRYWRASAWALERRYPARYSKRNPRMVTMAQVAQILSQFADLVLDEVPTPEYRERIIARLGDLATGLQEGDAEDNAS